MVLDALALRMGQKEYVWNSGSIERVMYNIIKEVGQLKRDSEQKQEEKKRKEKGKQKGSKEGAT